MNPYIIALKINQFFKTLALPLPTKIILPKKSYKYFDKYIRDQEYYDDSQLQGFRDVGVKVGQSNLREFLGKGLEKNQFLLMGIVFEEGK